MYQLLTAEEEVAGQSLFNNFGLAGWADFHTFIRDSVAAVTTGQLFRHGAAGAKKRDQNNYTKNCTDREKSDKTKEKNNT